IIVVDGFGTASGAFTLHITNPVVPPPSSATPTATPPNSTTPTATRTATNTTVPSPTNTLTSVPTNTRTNTPVSTPTPTRTNTPTAASTATATAAGCGTVLPSVDPYTVTGSTAGAPNLMTGASCGGGGDGAPDATFVYTAPRTASYTFDTFGSAFDTILYVRN